MLHISDHIKKLPKRSLKKWISARKKENRSEDWSKELEKLEYGIERISKQRKEN